MNERSQQQTRGRNRNNRNRGQGQQQQWDQQQWGQGGGGPQQMRYFNPQQQGRYNGPFDQFGGFGSGFFQGSPGGVFGRQQEQVGGGRRRNRNRGRDNDTSILGTQDRQQGQQTYAGLGPRDYRRNDDTIRDEVNGILTRHGGIDGREIQVQVRNGEVTLTGTVLNRRMKLLTEQVIDRVSGVKDIHNQLRIHPQESSSVTPDNGTGRSSNQTHTRSA